jgi:hypothetical protein
MASIYDIVDNKGRVNYEQLRQYVSSHSLADFTAQVKHPFLVGKELYDGEISKKIAPKDQVGVSSSSTMRFSAAAFRESLKTGISGGMGETTSIRSQEPPVQKNTGISHAIYMIRKKLYSTENDPNTITIGRGANNDIVIADYVVSKQHAQIIIFKGMYFIVDLESTNGTKVNHRTVNPQMKVQLQLNSTIAFGRLCFVFTHPLNVYRGMRKEILGF